MEGGSIPPRIIFAELPIFVMLIRNGDPETMPAVEVQQWVFCPRARTGRSFHSGTSQFVSIASPGLVLESDHVLSN